MGLPKLKLKMSVADYLRREKISPVRHEYIDGEVHAMAGTSDNHARIAGNIFVALSIHLRDSPCEPFSGDIKVRVTSKVYYYPDVLVAFEDAHENPYFRNKPILSVEVTSASTKHIDRREKLLFYLQIKSLREYVIIDQERMNVEVHRRRADGSWITYYFDEPDETVEFASVELTLPITEIYRRVKFDK